MKSIIVTGYILVPRIPIQRSLALCPITYSLLSALSPLLGILIDVHRCVSPVLSTLAQFFGYVFSFPVHNSIVSIFSLAFSIGILSCVWGGTLLLLEARVAALFVVVRSQSVPGLVSISRIEPWKQQ